MAELGTLVTKIRSKNAGPFWVTVDVFCGSAARFAELCQTLDTPRLATLYGVAPERLKRFEIADLNVIKLSFPRPVVQGAPEDRDQHGAQYAVLLQELDI